MIRIVLAICLLASALVRDSRADSGDDGERTARLHYERGQKLFNLQKFDLALDQFQSAYDAKPIPAFLFNIGQCHRNLGAYEAAIFSFKKFLALEPGATNREQVELLIVELEDRLAKANVAKPVAIPSSAPLVAPSHDAKPFYKRWWFWTGIAVASVGAGVGIYVTTAPDPGAPATTFGNIVFGK